MNRQWNKALIFVLLVGCVIASCNTEGDLEESLLAGLWLSNDADERWTFDSDGAFVNETYSGGSWQVFMSGSFSYDPAIGTMTVHPGGAAITMDVLLNPSVTRMAQGVHALRGGSQASLLGVWEGQMHLPGADQTHRWTFAGGSPAQLTYREILSGSYDNSATGDVVVNTAAKTFAVSNSNDTGLLANGTYSYALIGSGITIAEPGNELEYFDRQ